MLSWGLKGMLIHIYNLHMGCTIETHICIYKIFILVNER